MTICALDALDAWEGGVAFHHTCKSICKFDSIVDKKKDDLGTERRVSSFKGQSGKGKFGREKKLSCS